MGSLIYDSDKYCTIGQYASYFGVTRRTAYNHYYKGKIVGAFKDEGASNMILIPIEYIRVARTPNVVIYATVSGSQENRKALLDAEILKMRKYCIAKGYKVTAVVSEYSYGLFDERPKFTRLLENQYVKHIVVMSRSSVSRLSFEFIDSIMKACGREIEFISSDESDESLFKKELVDTIYVICQKLGSKEVTYEDVRKSMVSLGIADRKNNVSLKGKLKRRSKGASNK